MRAWYATKKQNCYVPRRYIIILLCCLAALCISGNRQIAMHYALFDSAKLPDNYSQCPEWEIITDVYFGKNYSKEEKASYRVAYGLGALSSPIIVGYLADQYGPKHPLAFCQLSTLLGTTVISLINFFKIAIPVIVGQFCVFFVAAGFLAYGACFIALISHWVPRDQLHFLTAVAFCGHYLGIATIDILKHVFRWVSASVTFSIYFSAAASVAWCVLWQFFGYSSPTTHLYIGVQEKEHLKQNLEGHVVFGRKKVPMIAMVKSCSLWSAILGNMATVWSFHLRIQNTPMHLNRILLMDLTGAGRVQCDALLIAVVLVLSLGYASDHWVRKNYVTVLTLRKIYTTVGIMGTGVFGIASTFAGCKRGTGIILLMASEALSGMAYIGVTLAPVDMARNYSGLIAGIASFFGMMLGVVIYLQQADNLLTTDVLAFRMMYLINLSILTLGAIAYSIVGTTDEQPWNKPKLKEESNVVIQ